MPNRRGLAIAALREWISRLGGLFGRSRSDQDLAQELKVHLEMAEEDLRRQGVPAETAARQARLTAGQSVQTMETLRDRRGIPALGTFWLDTKLGLRMLRKSWGLTLIGGLTLAAAMTIGASVFHLVNAIRGTTLPLEEGDRIVVIQPLDAETRQHQMSSQEDFERWRTAVRSVENVGAFRTVRRSLIGANGQAALVMVAEMSASGFQTPRVAPLLGRFILSEDELPAASPVVVIGFDVWQTRFAASPEILGQYVRLDGVSHTIVGVMPKDFGFPVNHQYWTRLGPNAADRVVVFARLAPGESVESAHAEIRAMGLLATEPGRPIQPRLVPYISGIGLSGGSDGALLAVLPFVLPLLLIPPCANLAILIYARTVARQGEFAARSALGASRGRIVAQILVEVLLLAAAAAGLAVILTPKATEFLKSIFAMGDQPFWMDFGLSYETMLFAGGLALIAAMIAGGIPTLRATGRWEKSGIHSLRGGSHPQLGKMWTVVVVMQVALCVAAAPTIAEVAWDTMRPAVLGPGFRAGEFLTARLRMDPSAGSASGRFHTFRDEFVRRLAAEPGVKAVTMSAAVPFEEPDVNIEVYGGAQRERKAVNVNDVDNAFFDAFGVPLLTGRRLAAGDVDAVVVNRSFSRRIVDGANPLGQRIRVIDADIDYEIVGVVGDLFVESRIPTMYRMLSNAAAGAQTGVRLTIQTGPSMPANLTGRLREITAAVDPSVRLDEIQKLDEIYRLLSIGALTGGGLLAGLTLCGVLFSVAGIYTSVAFTIVQQRREIGIRSALGAPPGRLLAGVFRQVLLPLGAGVAVGGLAAMLLAFYLSPVLFDDGRPLPWILPATEAAMSLIAAIALYGPVRRALRVDPMEAVRES